VDRQRFLPFETYLVLLREAIRAGGADFQWRRYVYEFESDRLAIDLLLGRDDLRPVLEQGAQLEEMTRLWRDDLSEFVTMRRRYLIYAE